MNIQTINDQIANIENCLSLLKESIKILVVEDQPVNTILKKLELIKSEILNSNLEKSLKIGDR